MKYLICALMLAVMTANVADAGCHSRGLRRASGRLMLRAAASNCTSKVSNCTTCSTPAIAQSAAVRHDGVMTVTNPVMTVGSCPGGICPIR